MGRIEKTVFISYRRSTGAVWALAISQNLTQSGYDVFFDYQGIASGDFEQIILENIKARAHFLVLMTPSAPGIGCAEKLRRGWSICATLPRQLSRAASGSTSRSATRNRSPTSSAPPAWAGFPHYFAYRVISSPCYTEAFLLI